MTSIESCACCQPVSGSGERKVHNAGARSLLHSFEMPRLSQRERIKAASLRTTLSMTASAFRKLTRPHGLHSQARWRSWLRARLTG